MLTIIKKKHEKTWKKMGLKKTINKNTQQSWKKKVGVSKNGIIFYEKNTKKMGVRKKVNKNTYQSWKKSGGIKKWNYFLWKKYKNMG